MTTRSVATIAGVAGALLVAALTNPTAHETAHSTARAAVVTDGCQRPAARVTLSATRYPNIADHIRDAQRLGYPRVLRVNRIGASTRRDQLLQGIPTRPNFDRDEYPPAMARATVKADVRYVPSSENRSAGSVMGHQLGRFRDGSCFVFRFTP